MESAVTEELTEEEIELPRRSLSDIKPWNECKFVFDSNLAKMESDRLGKI